MKTVSVHIVTYNSEDDIIPCLEAVQKQSYPILEVVIIDNASADKTVEKILHLKPYFGPRFQLIRNEKNMGFAPAHNQAIILTETDYVLVLNPDVILGTEYVERLVFSFEKNQHIGSATGKLLRKEDTQIMDSAGIVLSKSRRVFDRGSGEAADAWNEAGEVFGVSGAAGMYSRRMINDISMQDEFYDDSFFSYKEDADVAWRAQLKGWKAYYEASAIAYHERGWKQHGRSSQPLFIRKMSYINRYKMMYKNDSLGGLLKHILYLLPYELGSFMYFLFREPVVLTSWRTFFTELPSLQHKRRQIRQKNGTK